MTDQRPLAVRHWRAIASFFIIGHLLAMVLPPLAFQTRGPRGLSPSVATALWPIERYSQLLYLDRGFAFFAPDPGPSHLVRLTTVAETTETPGAEPVTSVAATFPDLQSQWPRLKYHRYFMIAEFLHDAYQPGLPADAGALIGPELTVEALQAWRIGRQRYDRLADSILRHWTQRLNAGDGSNNGALELSIERIEHQLPDFVGFTERSTPLNDPLSYRPLEDETIDLQSLMNAPIESVPAPDAEGSLPETTPPTTAPATRKTDAFLEAAQP